MINENRTNDLLREAEKLAFDRCVEFLIRMLEKYGGDYMSVSIEEIRALFPNRQSRKPA